MNYGLKFVVHDCNQKNEIDASDLTDHTSDPFHIIIYWEVFFPKFGAL